MKTFNQLKQQLSEAVSIPLVAVLVTPLFTQTQTQWSRTMTQVFSTL